MHIALDIVFREFYVLRSTRCHIRKKEQCTRLAVRCVCATKAPYFRAQLIIRDYSNSSMRLNSGWQHHWKKTNYGCALSRLPITANALAAAISWNWLDFCHSSKRMLLIACDIANKINHRYSINLGARRSVWDSSHFYLPYSSERGPFDGSHSPHTARS